jgi:hypothetical protein
MAAKAGEEYAAGKALVAYSAGRSPDPQELPWLQSAEVPGLSQLIGDLASPGVNAGPKRQHS